MLSQKTCNIYTTYEQIYIFKINYINKFPLNSYIRNSKFCTFMQP